MASELEKFRNLIEECCRRGDFDAKILRDLQAAGSGVGREQTRRWIKNETLLGRLAARKPSGRGRPATKSASSLPPLVSENSLLPTIPTPPSDAKTLDAAVVAETFAIPIDEVGRLDSASLARLLGTAKLRKMSELEFFLVESHANPWCDHPKKWTKEWVESVQKSAKALREQMLEVAQMHEIAQGMQDKNP